MNYYTAGLLKQLSGYNSAYGMRKNAAVPWFSKNPLKMLGYFARNIGGGILRNGYRSNNAGKALEAAGVASSSKFFQPAFWNTTRVIKDPAQMAQLEKVFGNQAEWGKLRSALFNANKGGIKIKYAGKTPLNAAQQSMLDSLNKQIGDYKTLNNRQGFIPQYDNAVRTINTSRGTFNAQPRNAANMSDAEWNTLNNRYTGDAAMQARIQSWRNRYQVNNNNLANPANPAAGNPPTNMNGGQGTNTFWQNHPLVTNATGMAIGAGGTLAIEQMRAAKARKQAEQRQKRGYDRMQSQMMDMQNAYNNMSWWQRLFGSMPNRPDNPSIENFYS